MANNLTPLIPIFYEALDVVSRELVGFIPAVTLDARAERAAIGQEIRSPVTSPPEATDVTPGVTPPDDGDQSIGARVVKITKARRVPIRWTGEEQRALESGVGMQRILRDQFAQAMRVLCNEVERDIASTYFQASRAHGTAGTTPFAEGLQDTALVRKILVDNGAPTSDLQLVIDTEAGARLRSLAQLTKANEAGTDTILRQGELITIHGLQIRESAQIRRHTAGSASGYLVNYTAGYPVGATEIAVDTGTGSFQPGDVVTFDGDPDQYVVTAVPDPSTIRLAPPGLRQPLTDNTPVNVVGSYVANIAFARSAIVLVARPPAVPAEGDLATDRTIITDPRSGLSFEVAMYPQYRQIQYEVAIAWGVAVMKPEHVALLLG